MEEIDLAPEHFFEVGFHAGVFQGRNEGVEDVGDGDRKALPIGHRARIRLVKGAVAVELQLVERMGGLGCSVGGFIGVVVGVDRHRFLASGPQLVRASSRAAFMGCESRHGGRPFTPPSGPERMCRRTGGG